jgi:hypothetical protein
LKQRKVFFVQWAERPFTIALCRVSNELAARGVVFSGIRHEGLTLRSRVCAFLVEHFGFVCSTQRIDVGAARTPQDL